MEKLKILTFNCRGLKNNQVSASNVCHQSDIVALQETLLWPCDVNLTDGLHPDFKGFSKSAMDVTNKIIKGRPFGGLSFLWRKSLDESIRIINYNSDRLLGLRLAVQNSSILFINVYMPWDSPDHFEDYTQLLGTIYSIIQDSDTDHICLLGDFNAHPTRPFYIELERFCQAHSLVISDIAMLPPTSFTRLGHRLGIEHFSWLDHYITSQRLHQSIENCNIRYDLVSCSDHIPIQIALDIPALPASHPSTQRLPKVNWKFDNPQKSFSYTALSEINLRRITPPADALQCNDTKCNHAQHRRDLTAYYSNLTDALLRTGTEIFRYISGNARPVPGWNEFVKDLHQHARNAFLHWRDYGSPREGPLALEMRRTRSRFKLALRNCRSNEAQLRADALSNKQNSHNDRLFWKDVRSLSPKANNSSQRVGDAVGEVGISEMWATNFSSVLNCINDHNSINQVNVILSGRSSNEVFERISSADVCSAIKQLAGNKATGCDGLPAEAYKFAHPILHELLADLFNACLIHQFLPEALLLVHLIPLIKNKLKDASDPGNYRPIAITTISSKIFESLLFTRLKPFLETSDNQFGFKPNHSTDACIYLLKELINYYASSNSPVFLCFVDVRKAFDRVNYHKLFLKLHGKGTPLYLIGILNYWFSTQQFCVSWGNVLSSRFGSSNGLRQGGILSPHLFNAYTDDLNHHLNTLPVGCTVNGITINNLCYADDMVLLSPSVSGLQRLIDNCCDFAAANDIIYNETKTQCMRILPKALRHLQEPEIKLGDHRLQFVNEFPYLGHIITNDMKDTTDIEHRRRKLCSLGNMITRRFAFCNEDTKFTLFRSFCYSIYGCSLWFNHTQEHFRRLKVVHNNILRRLTNTPRVRSASELFMRCSLRNLDAIRIRTIQSLKSRLMASNNSLIIHTLESEARLSSPIWLRWEGLDQVN